MNSDSEDNKPDTDVEVEAEVVDEGQATKVLDDNRKSEFVCDFASICDVEPTKAREILESHDWNMQNAINAHFGGGDGEDGEEDEEMAGAGYQLKIVDPNSGVDHGNLSASGEEMKPGSSSSSYSTGSPPEMDTRDLIPKSPLTECKREIEIEIPASPGDSRNFTSWAPEKFSVLSWNVDGLDDKNLEKRMIAVVDLINKEKHGVVFLQELLPYTFEFIARKLAANYFPVIGTENPNCEYFTATFLRLHQINYEDHFIVPYRGTSMDRNLLVTKAFIGRAKLALLNTHLESTADFESERVSQLKQCFSMADTFPKEYNVIFGGDLNLRDKEVAGNLPQEMCDLWVKCGSRSTCQYTWDLTRNTNKQMPSKYQPRCRFDRLYFKDSMPKTLTPQFFAVTGIEKVAGTQSFPSDHWAILSFFRLEQEARKPIAKKRKADTLMVE